MVMVEHPPVAWQRIIGSLHCRHWFLLPADGLSTVAGFYRTCVVDGVVEHSPAEHVRRPPVTTLSPTLGLSYLQFEAILNTARLSPNPNDFALVWDR
jgi:hypothetical protein